MKLWNGWVALRARFSVHAGGGASHFGGAFPPPSFGAVLGKGGGAEGSWGW